MAHQCLYEEPAWIDSDNSSVLYDYNSSRISNTSISGNPYESAARIPIAFIPAGSAVPTTTSATPMTNTTTTTTPATDAGPEASQGNAMAKKKRSNHETADHGYIQSLERQIVSLQSMITELSNMHKDRTSSRSGSYGENHVSPHSVEITGLPDTKNVPTPAQLHEFIDFYGDYRSTYVRKSRIMYHGPFSHYTILTRDKFLLLGYWTINDRNSKPQKIKDFLGVGASPESTKKEVVPLTLSVEDLKANLHGQVSNVLPYQKVIWLLIRRFFDYVYPYYPYIDQDDFVGTVADIIGPEDFADAPVTVSLRNRTDFAHLGLLLIVLRMAFLSVINNKPPEEDAVEERRVYDYLTASPMSFNVITVAQLCLNQFRILRKVSLPTFQLALYMRIYNRHAPEYDGNSDTFDLQIFTGLLFQMGFAAGLHKDSEYFEPTTRHLRRKMWFCLKEMDLEESLSTGIILRIKDQDSDTQLPGFVHEHPGSFKDIMENRLVKNLSEEAQTSAVLRELVSKFTAFGKCRIRDVLEQIQVLQSPSFLKYTSLKQIMVSANFADERSRCRMIKRYLDIKYVAICLQYHLMLHYEEVEDYEMARMHLFKLLEANMDVLANYDFRRASAVQLHSGNEFLFYTFQSIYLISFLTYFALFLRCDKYALEIQDTVRFEELQRLKRSLTDNMTVLLFSGACHGTTHYTTWRYTCSLYSIVSRIKASGFFFKNGANVDKPKIARNLHIPAKNLTEGCTSGFLSQVQYLCDRNPLGFLAVNQDHDYGVGLAQDDAFYQSVVNNNTWTKHKEKKSGDRFYANLSNHNISYDGLNDGISELFNDIIDF